MHPEKIFIAPYQNISSKKLLRGAVLGVWVLLL
jgi:hypothetical protein